MINKLRIVELDALRGIAVICIMLYHYTHHIYAEFNNNWYTFDIGFYGVHLFFIISGFVIFMTVEKITNPIEFLINRISRLVPAYLFAVILTYTVLVFISNQNISVIELFINLTMFQEFVGIAHIDGVYWTLTKELTFYFIIYLFIKIKIKNVENALISILSIIFLIKVLSKIQIGISLEYFLFLTNLLQFFVIGIVFYLIYKNKSINKKQVLILLFSLLITFGNMNYTTSISIIMISILFILALFFDIDLFKNKVLLFMGKISYSFYLIHNELGALLIDKTYDTMGGGSLVMAFIFSVIVATIMFYLIEKPIGIVLKNKLTGKFI